MKEDEKNELEMNFIIEQSLDLYIIYKLKRENLINEKEYYYLKEKIQSFKYMTTDMKKNSI